MSLTLVIILPLLVIESFSLDLCKSETSKGSSYLARNVSEQNCGCKDTCLRRCCKPGYYYSKKFCYGGKTDGNISVPVYKNKVLVKRLSEIENFLIGVPNCNMFRVNLTVEEFYVQTNTTVWVPMYENSFNANRYCVDEANGFSALLCFPSPKRVEVFKSTGMIISMPFLLLTFLVYLILPESNIHRKSLMFYVMTLFLGYLILVGVQLNESTIPDGLCHTLGYGIIFFFISSFFWMNVMCVDMWLTFSGLRGFKGKRSTERKRFIIYCIYALGTPFILLFIVFLVNTYGNTKSIFHPHLGVSRCFLEDGYPNLFYFYLPMAIIIGINIAMFTLTALKIQKVKKETSMLKQSDNKRHSFEEDKQKFNLYVKLLFAMGINWTMEVISWAVGWAIPSTSTYIWYFTDFANAAYGVFIFFIFVFKWKIWISVKKRYYVWRGRPHLAQALSTSNRTRTRDFSTTDTTVTTDYRMSDLKNGKQDQERPLNQN